MEKPSYLNFNNKNYKWKNDIDYRKSPEAHRVGKGEQGVLICQPYKNEILPYWKFKTPETAKESSERIYAKLTLCKILNSVKMENGVVVAYNYLTALTLFGKPFCLFYVQFF